MGASCRCSRSPSFRWSGSSAWPVDYSRGNSLKVAVQSGLDATALAMAKSASTLTPEELSQRRTRISGRWSTGRMRKSSHQAEYSDPGRRRSLCSAPRQCRPDLSGRVQLLVQNFTKLEVNSFVDDQMGQPAPARRARTRHHRIDGQRQQDRRTEDRDQESARPAQGCRRNPTDVYVSIVPFSKDVNVGWTNSAASWLQFDDGTDKSWDGTNGTCSKSGYSPRSSCTPPAPARCRATTARTVARPPAPARSRATPARAVARRTAPAPTQARQPRAVAPPDGLHEFGLLLPVRLQVQRPHLGLRHVDDRHLDRRHLDTLGLDAE